MPEMKDKVIAELLRAGFSVGQINYVLGMREVALVNRDAELPYFTRHSSEEIERLTKGEVYGLCRIDMLKEGWVKEVK